jgi:pimeloyl-ACP methyl ester carboxylesterase
MRPGRATVGGVSRRQTIALPDGRDLEFLTAGPEDGFPLVLHDGTPVGLKVFRPTISAASGRGLRVIQIARPGYERSTARPGRRVADVAADVARVLDHLDAETFVTAGWSGGGPHALACAALLPARCLAAASVAGLAPFHAAGLDWTAGMALGKAQEFGIAAGGPQELTAFLEAVASNMATITGADVSSLLSHLVSAVDAAALTGEFADSVAEGQRAGVAGGVAGWRDDDMALVSDWGFAMDGDMPPVAIWHGDQDRLVPLAHGRWLAANVPGARAHLTSGQGHLTVTVSLIGSILDDLLDLAGLTVG